MTAPAVRDSSRSRDYGSALLEARRDEVDEIVRTLRRERALVITGEHQVGKTRLLQQTAAMLTVRDGVRVARLDLRYAASDVRLAWRWLRSIAAAVAGPVAFSHLAALAPSMWPEATRAADVAVRRILGSWTEWALAERPAEISSDAAAEAVAAARDATLACAAEARTVFIIDHVEAPFDAPRAPFDVGRLLWGLRPGADPTGQLHLAVVCHPAVLDTAAGSEAALFGAMVMTIKRPARLTWRAALDGDADALRRIDDILARSTGHIRATILLLHALRADPAASIGATFDDLMFTQHSHAERCVRHAATLHRLGAQLFETVARGERPYQANPDARSSRDIAAAMTVLWRAGLLTRPEKGRWEVADPFVARLLASTS